MDPQCNKNCTVFVVENYNGRRDDGNEIRRGASPAGNRGPPVGENRYRPPAFREGDRDRDNFRRNDDRDMRRDGPPPNRDREDDFRRFEGGRRDRDMRGGDDDEFARRRDDRPPPPRDDRLRDRDQDDLRRRDDMDSGFKRGYNAHSCK